MRFLIALVAAMFIAFYVGHAFGEPVCHEGWAPRGKMITSLAQNYQEAPVALGLAANGSVIELIRTKDGETWTLINTHANGCSRLVANGEAWATAPWKAGGPES